MEKNRINELTEILNNASKQYYQGDSQDSGMTDKEYDALLSELEALEAATGYSLPNSPAKSVGHEVVSHLEKAAHKSPMMSLDKTKSAEKMLEFIGSHDALVSLKLDGLAIELTYEGGALKQALTRGNGLIGENITHSARAFTNIPLSIPFAEELRIRGEAVISFTDFNRINDELSLKYKNPRNLCAGTVRQLDNAAVKERNVRFIALSAADNHVSGKNFTRKSEILCFLRQIGFEVVKHDVVSQDGFIGVLDSFKSDLDNEDFATDGLVCSYDDIEYSRLLGTTSKFPRDSLAFKWADEEAETELITVEWNTSRTGLINPIAVFRPVEIEGTTVERASLHNVSIFGDLALGAGDTILVYKANMIIPQVSDNLTRSGGLEPPEDCPACGAATEIIANKDTETLHCTNNYCTARVVQTIAHFASRDCMNIEGLSEQTIIRLHELGILNSYADLYKLEEHKEMLYALKGFGKISVDKLLAAIDKSRACRLPPFINGLGIAGIGREYAKTLSARYGGDLGRIQAAEASELAMLHGFGEIIALNIFNFFRNEASVRIMNEALAHLTFVKDEDGDSRRLEGRVIVITGDLSHFANRGELREFIEKEGGRVASSVTSKTDLLINNDAGSGSSKNKKAAELGVRVVTEEEFLAFL